MGERYLTSALLLDTHILIRWLAEPRKLSKEQERAIARALDRNELLNISAATLIEVAAVFGRGSKRSSVSAEAIFDALDASSEFQTLPINVGIGRETEALGGLFRDPWDRVIVATGRIYGLRLVTSDQAIIDSKLIPVIE